MKAYFSSTLEIHMWFSWDFKLTRIIHIRIKRDLPVFCCSVNGCSAWTLISALVLTSGASQRPGITSFDWQVVGCTLGLGGIVSVTTMTAISRDAGQGDLLRPLRFQQSSLMMLFAIHHCLHLWHNYFELLQGKKWRRCKGVFTIRRAEKGERKIGKGDETERLRKRHQEWHN